MNVSKLSAASTKRKQRERVLRDLSSRLQRTIDANRGRLWEHFFAEFAGANPNGLTGTYCQMFDKAWRRSLLPNSQRDDMDRDGNYKATGTS